MMFEKECKDFLAITLTLFRPYDVQPDKQKQSVCYFEIDSYGFKARHHSANWFFLSTVNTFFFKPTDILIFSFQL